VDTTKCPTVLVLDDQAPLLSDEINNLPPDLAKCFRVRGPEEATDADLKAAHLVLVDYKLDEWKENNTSSGLCKYVPNGLALTAILQQRAISSAHPVAFAIHSAHLPELTDPLPHEPRLHLLSRICNIDWAFEKDDPRGQEIKYRQIVSLAEAVCQLPDAWPRADGEKTRAKAQKLLQINEALPWAVQTWSDVERARPPLDELVQRVHGLLFLRWVLQRVLSYPCFLLDETWLAARLAVTRASLRDALPVGLSDLFGPVEYTGILTAFRGKRWWRMGVEYVLWDIGGKSSLGAHELRRLLIEKRGFPLIPTESLHPVVCLDTDFLPLEQLYDPSEAVRILPDDWPPYAEQAWTTIQVALGDKRMNGLVIEADRPRLDDLEQAEVQ